MIRIRAILLLLLCIGTNSCALFKSEEERRIDTAYELVKLIKQEDYNGIKKKMAFGRPNIDEGIYNHNIKISKYLLDRFGVPERNKLQVEFIERGRDKYTIIMFPLHKSIESSDSVIYANVKFTFSSYTGNGKIIAIEPNILKKFVYEH